MPIPKPNTGEDKEHYIERCMGNDVMNTEYPDRDQRYAVCNSQWRRRNRAMQRVRIKSGDAWEDKSMDVMELEKWFRDNTKDGAVTGEIELFRDATFEIEKQEDGSVDWVMSDMSLDRDQERVDPEGADFKNFKKNPVVLWAHDHERPAIGKVVNPKVKDGRVVGKIQFDDKDTDEFAWMVGQKVKKGIINGGSIGFKPNNIEFVEDSKDPTRLIHRKWELMEFSICNVPANANAVAQREAEPDTEKEDLKKEVADLKAKVAEMENAKKTYIDVLLQDRGETSTDEETVESEIDRLFVAGESSGQAETNKLMEMFER